MPTMCGTEPPSKAGYKSAITPPSQDVAVYNPFVIQCMGVSKTPTVRKSPLPSIGG